MPPKKAPVAPGVTAIFVDIGAHTAMKTGDTCFSDFREFAGIARKIIRRKLFSLDTERFVIGAFNADESFEFGGRKFENVHVGDTEFKPAFFDHLDFIEHFARSNTVNACFMKGMKAAIALLRSQEPLQPSSSTLILITNGFFEDLREDCVDYLVRQLQEADIELLVIGIEKIENLAQERICRIVGAIEGRQYKRKRAMELLAEYESAVKNIKRRSFRKAWEIAPGIRLPVTFDLKSDIAPKPPLKFTTIDEAGNELVRINKLSVEGKEGVKSEEPEDGPTSSERDTVPRAAPTTEFKYGYNFGKTVIMMDPNELKEKYNDHNFNEKEKGGVLKLIQFTKRANIMDSYLMAASAKTVLPDVSGPPPMFDACNALIRSMHELRVAAICRFAHNAAFHVQLVALLPHRDEETDVYYLRSVKLPFADDMRTLKFPKVTFENEKQRKEAEKPRMAQLAAVDDLIDNMQLDGPAIERLVEGGLSDPRFQLQCNYLQNFVTDPASVDAKQAEERKELVKSIMRPQMLAEEQKPELFERLTRQFQLQNVATTKRERVEVQPEDLQHLIDEWTAKRRKTDSEKDGKRQNASTKMSRDDEIRRDVQDGKSAEICSKVLQMIGDTCRFQQSGSVVDFYNLLLNELVTVRQVLVEHAKCEEFNEVLRKVKEEEHFEPFAEFLAENKTCYPIFNEEVDASEITKVESEQFWDDI